MRTKILVLFAFALILSANLRAQVSIGDLTAPASGALLDLNKTVKGGLALSNVTLEDLHTIPATFPGMTPAPADLGAVKTNFTGAIVYHTGGYGIPTGIYVWNGSNWTFLDENCTPLDASRLTLTAPLLNVKQGDTETFSVSSDASLRCADGETYIWSVTPAAVISELSGAQTSITFDNTGTYTVTATVKSPYSFTPVSKSVSVNVTATGGVPLSMININYGIVGETCLDVKNAKLSTESDPAYNARVDDFEQPGDYVKTYKFLHTAAYSDLVLSCYDDPANILEEITTYPPESAGIGVNPADGYYEEEFTLKFKSNIKTLVPANGESATVKLIASYKPAGESDDKLAYLEIRVENGTCVCPAKVSDTGWLNFMCHNLGADYDIISYSQLIRREHHGDWYRFGAKIASMENVSGHGDNWDYPDYYTAANSEWPDSLSTTIGNPCPDGWRIPTATEWEGVLANNDWPGALVSGDSFCHIRPVNDYLYLPLAGHRIGYNGGWYGLGNMASYMSSTGTASNVCTTLGATNGNNKMERSTGRDAGGSVRCVSAE
jgi:uncharacterized protein (TIGR02145 family)